MEYPSLLVADKVALLAGELVPVLLVDRPQVPREVCFLGKGPVAFVAVESPLLGALGCVSIGFSVQNFIMTLDLKPSHFKRVLALTFRIGQEIDPPHSVFEMGNPKILKF